ncbi:MAG: GNAT family N-acetyltransferase [Planctomycetaceae bacterium]
MNGVGRRLLDAAEAFAASRGAKQLRIGVLAANAAAHNLYTRPAIATTKSSWLNESASTSNRL